MTTSSNRVERRAGQRFPYLIPVSLRVPANGIEAHGFTQDVSSRGVFFFTDAVLTEAAEIELTLRMPSEVTLGESMRVRCRGRILRVVCPVSGAAGAETPSAQTKIGVAVRFESYEYLPESSESTASFPRVTALHSHRDDEQPVALRATRP
jgi:hypothetical protein